ncbi:ATPase [Bisgaard Taxon 45]|uniref:ATPase n=1 Tax=Bisgaard Taxon 45 TaxID=304289 RepID=A0ABT9KCM9_9PAST|nr:ATPase [Bisgaard Taxon 45]
MMLSKELQATLERWFHLSPLQRMTVCVVIFAFLFVFPLSSYWQTRETLRQVEQDAEQQQQIVQHQKHILASLERNHLSQQITPDLTAQLTEINQFIAIQLAHFPDHSSQWTFQSLPQLTLHFTSNFEQCQLLLTELLTQYPQLFLLSLQISQNEETDVGSILTEASFQLQPITAK